MSDRLKHLSPAMRRYAKLAAMRCGWCGGKGWIERTRWSDAIGSTIADDYKCTNCNGTGEKP